jgi:U3 small nucleolar ribonucleoprotein protein LCP5
MVQEKVEVQDDLVAYLEAKQQLLLAYITNMIFYLYMKAIGKSVKSHPVMSQLLRLRFAMEKLQTIDQKVKYQIDRLVTLADSQVTATQFQKSLLRPNLSAMMMNDSDEEEEDNNNKNKNKNKKKQQMQQQKKAIASDDDDEDEAEDEVDGDHDNMEEEHDRKAMERYKASKLMSMPYPVSLSQIKLQ